MGLDLLTDVNSRLQTGSVARLKWCVWEGPASTWQTYSLHVVSKTHILLAQCTEKVLSENSNYKRFGLA